MTYRKLRKSSCFLSSLDKLDQNKGILNKTQKFGTKAIRDPLCNLALQSYKSSEHNGSAEGTLKEIQSKY
jgi:hypothetical protein